MIDVTWSDRFEDGWILPRNIFFTERCFGDEEKFSLIDWCFDSKKWKIKSKSMFAMKMMNGFFNLKSSRSKKWTLFVKSMYDASPVKAWSDLMTASPRINFRPTVFHK